MSTNLLTGAGAVLSIGGNSPTDSYSDFASDSYTPVGELENINEISRERNPVEFASLADARTRVARGVEAVSIIEATFAYVSGDNGQDALIAAFEEASQQTDNYNFRIQLNDGASGVADGTTIYFRGPVLSMSLSGIDNENVIRRMVRIARNSEWIEIPAQAGSGA
jgi:hypothetical protein